MSAKDTFFHKREFIKIRGELFDLSTPRVMGILNVTPDSFYDGGSSNVLESALAKAQKMIDNGADIIDVGGQSTRPGAEQLSFADEWNRIRKVIPALRSEFKNCIISVDTFYSQVAERAINEGADMVNDVSAGKMDAQMFKTVSELQVPYVLMHMQGSPQNMQANPTYKDVVAEVMRELSVSIRQLRDLGLNDIILDPGFGFGKTVEHNYEILNHLDDFKLFELPVLVGVSRKRMINAVLNIKPEDALNGTTALNAFALERGANILRVHDVKEAKELITLHQTMIA